MKYMTNDRPWSRLLRPVAITALSVGLGAGMASAAVAQTTPGGADLAGSLVALHDGSCGDSLDAAEFEVDTLELEEGYADAYGIAAEDAYPGDFDDDGVADVDEEGYLTEDLDDDGVLDEDEDLNDNGVLDVGIDLDDDGILDDTEHINASEVPGGSFVVLEADGEVDATFQELFDSDLDDEELDDEDALGDPGAIAIHSGSGGDVLACAELTVPEGWDDRDTVVVGLNPTGDSDFYAYAVFERDTGNVPIFGENTTGVTVYAFPNLDTLRDTRMMEGTPES